MLRSLTLLGILAAPALIAGCTTRPEPPAGAPPEITGVTTEEIRPGPVLDALEFSGTVRAATTTVVSSRASGHILRVAAREGERVRRGQLLVEIDSREAATQARAAEAGETEAQRALEEVEHAIRAAESAVQAAVTQRDLAATTLDRYRVLRERKSVSAQEFDEVQARHKTAEAEAARAGQMLESLKSKPAQVQARIEQARTQRASAALLQEYTQVLAPAAGLVTARHVEPGMVAAPGVPLLTIEDDARYQLEIPVDEERMRGVAVGSRMRVQLDALDRPPLELRVSEVLPKADAATRTFTVRIDLLPWPGLRSGLFGRAWLPSQPREALTVPEDLVVRRGQLAGVWTLDAEIVHYRLITAGKVRDGRVEVLSGLDAGDRVILTPRSGLIDGQRGRP